MAIELTAKLAALALKRDGRVQIANKLKLEKQWYSNQNHCLQEREWHKFIRKVEGGGEGVFANSYGAYEDGDVQPKGQRSNPVQCWQRITGETAISDCLFNSDVVLKYKKTLYSL